MKKITIFFIFSFLTTIGFSQGDSVANAEQFCAGGSELVFPNITGSPNTTSVGCLGTIPNAAYYYLQIDQPGDLYFTISQEDAGGTPIDVDFIAWGPFASIAAADAAVTLTDCPTCPNNTTDPTFYPYTPDDIIDCSYDIAPTETMTITGATTGQIYVVLITNYDGAAGNISFQQTGGTGTTSCANLPVCGNVFYDSGGDSGSYSNNETDTTTIYPYVAGGTVTVDFTSYNVAAGDVLTVYNGPDATYPVLGTVNSAPASFTSTDTSGTLTFVFTSNATGVNTGWEADITCTAPPVCGSTFYDSGGASGNYSNYENQTYTFYPDTAGDAVTATFTYFDIENCCDDFYVYDGPDATYPLIGTFAGNTIPGPFTSSDATGALTFVFESDISVTYGGWAANLTCAPYTPPPVCGTTFYDSGGASGNYSNNETSTTTLVPDVPATAITATFTTFNLEVGYDFLTVYNGPNTGSPSLGTYTGTTNPGSFTSTDPSGALTFVFISDGTVVGDGWAANITCTDTCDLTITETLNPLGADECSLIYDQLVATTSAGSGATISIFEENFNGATFPAGWNANNQTANTQWVISNTSYAGGAANEAMLDWISGTSDTGNWTLRSPAINIAGETNLQLSLKHYLWHFDASYPYSIYVQTNLDGAGWVNQYSAINVANNIGPETINIDLSSLTGNSLQIRFRMNGNPFGFFYWTIDDILLTADGPPSAPQITWSPTNGLYTDAGLTTPYAGGFTDTVYAAPDGTETYTAEDQNGCTDTVTVTRNRKVWNGSVDTNWYVDNNWTPNGIPTASDCVVIPDVATSNNRSPIADYSVFTPPTPPIPALGRNLTIEANGFLEIKNNSFIEINEWVNVDTDGLFLLRDSASLIQDPTATTNTNIGNISMQRSVTSLDDPYDYIYWSSPVESFNVESISPNTSPNLIWKWLPTQVTGGGIGNHGDWIHPAASESMALGTGYIVRNLIGTSPYPDTPAVPAATAEFTGRPNNGDINVSITRGTHTTGNYQGDNGVANGTTPQDDNWNLIGNPYPSAISYTDFIMANIYIDGTIYLWTHQNTPSAIASPFYEDFVYNYSDDYIDNNYTGSNPPGFNGNIASGQAFFVLMLDNASATEQVVFNNAMRSSSNENNQFYRENSSESRDITERHRIWLDLITPNNVATSILVGYIQGATNDTDRLYDGFEFEGAPISFYSLIEEKKMSIQGRTLPFIDSDQVPLGLVVPETGNYSIAINTLDGLFESSDQTIYLEDTYTNIIHDLRSSPYSFNINAGTYNDRFILRYTNNALSIDELNSNSELTITAPNSKYIKVKSGTNTINTIVVYDLLGRILIDKKDINTLEFNIQNVPYSDGAYIVKVTLNNNQQKIQKVVIRQ